LNAKTGRKEGRLRPVNNWDLALRVALEKSWISSAEYE
jgi:hypothetical protein